MFLAVGKCVAFDGDPWQKGTSTLGFSTLSQHCGLLGNELILKYKACPLPITPSHCILMGPKGGLVVHPTKHFPSHPVTACFPLPKCDTLNNQHAILGDVILRKSLSVSVEAVSSLVGIAFALQLHILPESGVFIFGALNVFHQTEASTPIKDFIFASNGREGPFPFDPPELHFLVYLFPKRTKLPGPWVTECHQSVQSDISFLPDFPLSK